MTKESKKTEKERRKTTKELNKRNNIENFKHIIKS
jgi:hypothetical protein